MLRLFHSIFGDRGSEPGRHPRALVDAAVERALDGTDPRMRAVSGYRKKLEPAVVHAIDHVVGLVDGLPAPVELDDGYRADPRLALFFRSKAHLREVLAGDRSIRDYLKSPEWAGVGHVCSLLLLQLEERQVFGMELDGGAVRREVLQVTVNVTGRRLLDPSPSEALARQRLKRRAFDHLLGSALRRITADIKERAGLEQERTLLRRKQKVLDSSGWSFGAAAAAGSPAPASAESRLQAIGQQLEALGGVTEVLDVRLGRVVEVLGAAETHLWKQHRALIVDSMGIRREQPSDTAPALDLEELHDADGETAIALPVSIAAGVLG